MDSHEFLLHFTKFCLFFVLNTAVETKIDNDDGPEQTDNATGFEALDDTTDKEKVLGNNVQFKQIVNDIRSELLDNVTNDEHQLGKDGNNSTCCEALDDTADKEQLHGNNVPLKQMDNDVQSKVLDIVTNDEHQLGKDCKMAGSSVQDVPQVDQNDKMTQNPSTVQLNVAEGDEPCVGQEFENEAAAHAFYSAYGMKMGFITRMNYHNRSKIDGSIVSRALVCNKEGYRKPYRHDVKNIVKSRAPTRVGCKAMISIRKMSTGKWVITKFVKEHTHPLAGCLASKAVVANQITDEDKRVQELTEQLLIERKRSASLRRFMDLLFNHIEEHTQGLSKKIQCVVDSMNKMESEGKNK